MPNEMAEMHQELSDLLWNDEWMGKGDSVF